MRILLVIIMALTLNADTKSAYLSLSKELRREIDLQMKSIKVQISNAIDNLSIEASSYVESNVGLPKKTVLKNLDDIKTEGGGIFANASKSLTGAVTDKTFAISENIFFGELKTELDMDLSRERMTWVAMLVNTCPSCLPLHGQVNTLRGWSATGGVPNERSTLCTIHGKCHCILVPSDTMPSKQEMRKPIKIQAGKIRKANKKRGKNYKQSTRKSFLGQVNNPTSTIADLRKIKKIK